MKITKSRMRQLISESIQKVLNEGQYKDNNIKSIDNFIKKYSGKTGDPKSADSEWTPVDTSKLSDEEEDRMLLSGELGGTTLAKVAGPLPDYLYKIDPSDDLRYSAWLARHLGRMGKEELVSFLNSYGLYNISPQVKISNFIPEIARYIKIYHDLKTRDRLVGKEADFENMSIQSFIATVNSVKNRLTNSEKRKKKKSSPRNTQTNTGSRYDSDILKHYKEAVKCIADLRTWKLGTTKVVDKPFYAFMVANKGGKKVGSGTVKPSQGMGKHRDVKDTRMGIAEAVLEDVRSKEFDDAVPRQGNVYLTPYLNGGHWSWMGDTVFLVAIPPGSKVTYVDGWKASETSTTLVDDGRGGSFFFMNKDGDPEKMKKRIPEAKKKAREYWSGIHKETYQEAEEIITNGSAKVIAPVDELPPFPPEFRESIEHDYLSDYPDDYDALHQKRESGGKSKK